MAISLLDIAKSTYYLNPPISVRNQITQGSTDSLRNFITTASLDLSFWEDLISFRPPIEVQQSLINVGSGWYIHHIEDAYGDINLDYYGVLISQLPIVGGNRISPDQLLNDIRLNINNFIDTNKARFSPYDANYATQWNSADPLGAVIHIDLMKDGVNPDDGSVVTSSYSQQSWIFSTIWTLGDFGHPVSGNRQFGYSTEGARYIFFTRGADRTTTNIDMGISDVVFGGGHELWLSLQQGIANYINNNGGAAYIIPPISNRWDWNDVSLSYFNPITRWL